MNRLQDNHTIPKHVFFTFALSLFTLSQAALLVKGAQSPPEILGFWRLFFALIISAILVKVRKEEFAPVSIRSQFKLVIITGVLFWLHFWLWFYSVSKTTIANSTLIFCMNPIFVALGGWLFEKQKLSGRLILALATGIVGLIIMQNHSLKFSPDQLLGDALALVASVAFAGYLLLVKRLRNTGSNFALTFWFNLVSFVGFAVVGVASGLPFWGYGWVSWACFVAMAAGPSLLGHALFTYSLKYLNAAIASCFVMTEPIMAAFSAAIIFKEIVPLETIIAFVLITAGLLNLFFFSEKFSSRKHE
jgi:drug/metabolite transporter (DMT)-like permease